MASARIAPKSKLLLIPGIVAIAWIMTIGPASSAATSGRIRAAITVLALLALLIIPEKYEFQHTVAMWIAFGTTFVLSLLLAFSAGLWGVISLACVLVYNGLHWEAFGTKATWVGAPLATAIMILMLPR